MKKKISHVDGFMDLVGNQFGLDVADKTAEPAVGLTPSALEKRVL